METTEAHTPTFVDATPNLALPCPKCGKEFKNQMGLRMHDLRKHSGRGWDTSGNFGRLKRAHEEEKRQKREYNRRLRERYYKEGKNSRGEPMPAGYKPRLQRKGIRLPAWSQERRSKFNSTWRSKNKKRQKETRKRFEPIVYPIQEEQKEVAQVVIPQMEYCPHCGEYLKAWRYQS